MLNTILKIKFKKILKVQGAIVSVKLTGGCGEHRIKSTDGCAWDGALTCLQGY
jgi:hypothetical protein